MGFSTGGQDLPVKTTTRRISVVGPSGSGKSHLSQTLTRLLGLPLYQLDQIRVGPSGRELSKKEFIAAVRAIVARDEWIIDGHYRDVRHLIWGRAEAVIWLNYAPLLVGWRLVRRALRKKFASFASRHKGLTQSDDIEKPAEIISASWTRRLNRIKNMLREHREYGVLLHQSNYPDTQIVEIVSIRQTQQWEAKLEERAADIRGGAAAQEHKVPVRSKSGEPGPGFIELFGLPGAGKTTLIDAIGTDPELKTRPAIADEWAHQSYLRKTGYFLRTLIDLRLIGSAIRLVIAARLTRPESLWRLFRLIIMKHWWLSRSGILLYDQGALQSLWSVLYVSGRTQPDPAIVTPLIRSIFTGMQTQIILIDVDKAIAARRIIGRTDGTSRFDGLSIDLVNARIARSTSLVHAIIAATRAAGIDVQTLQGAEPVPVLAGKLQQLLNCHKENRSQRAS